MSDVGRLTDRAVGLLMAVYRQAAGAAGQVQARSGLSVTDTRALAALDLIAAPSAPTVDGRPAGVAVSALTEGLGVTSGAATMIVDRLERAGLAARTHDPGDRRRVLVVPTEKAQSIGAAVLSPHLQLFRQALDNRSAAELHIIVDFLQQITGPSIEDPAGAARPEGNR